MSSICTLVASFCIEIPISWPITADTIPIVGEVWSGRWTNTFECDFVKNCISWAWKTLKWDHVDISVGWTADAKGSVPEWVISWASDTILRCLVVVSIQWACFTNVFLWIPSKRSNTDQALLSSWVQVTSLGTNAYISSVIIHQTLYTSYTFLIFFVPILRPIAIYASSAGEHEGRFNRTNTKIFDIVVDLTSWACNTFLKFDVPMLSWWAVITVLSIPDWWLYWAFGADGAVPERIIVRTRDTFLGDKIVVAFESTLFTLKGSEIPVGGHITFLTIFPIIIWVFRRTLTDFFNIMKIRMRQSMLFIFYLESEGQSK